MKFIKIYRYDGTYGVGGIGIQTSSSGLPNSFSSDYTFHIHHNNIHHFEHTAMYIGSISRVLVEYNDIHDNLDARLYFGGMKNGSVSKLFDVTPSGEGTVGNIFRYNYVHDFFSKT